MAAQERVRELSREVAIARPAPRQRDASAMEFQFLAVASATAKSGASAAWRDHRSRAVPASMADAIRTHIVVRQSLSWELTSPLRILHRIFRARAQPDACGSTIAEARSLRARWRAFRPPRTGKPCARAARCRPAECACPCARRHRIVFAMHEASRTGAPLILLSLVRHFAHAEIMSSSCFPISRGRCLRLFPSMRTSSIDRAMICSRVHQRLNI